MMWIALGVVAMVCLGLHTLYMSNTNKKIETKVDETLANVLKDHVMRAEHGPTSERK